MTRLPMNCLVALSLCCLAALSGCVDQEKKKALAIFRPPRRPLPALTVTSQPRGPRWRRPRRKGWSAKGAAESEKAK